jgi:hypothetical protein
MGGPACRAGHREDRRKGLPRNGEGVEQDRREELDIGLQRTVRILAPQGLADIGLDLAGEGRSAPSAASRSIAAFRTSARGSRAR